MKPNTWIRRLAYEARRRHAADRVREDVAAARRALISSRALTDLHLAVAADVERFEHRGNGAAPLLTCKNSESSDGFFVSRTDDQEPVRSLTIELDAGVLACCYGNGFSDHKPRKLAVDVSESGAFSFWEEGVHRSFADAAALSGFLLAPVLDRTDRTP